MKKLMKTLYIGLAIIPITILIAHLDRYIQPNSYISSEKETFFLNSMVCSMCVANIEKTLMETEGVIKAEVSLESKEVYVTFNDQLTNIEKIEESITAAGYNANDKAANPEAFEMLSECCKNPENAGDKHDSNCEGEQMKQKSCTNGCCNN